MFGFATLIEPSGGITQHVINALPKPDCETGAGISEIDYLHRTGAT